MNMLPLLVSRGIEALLYGSTLPSKPRKVHLYSPLTARGDYCGTTKARYVEVLEFTHFVSFFSFDKIGENHKEKLLVNKVTVVVALDLGTGNTKNPDNESGRCEIFSVNPDLL